MDRLVLADPILRPTREPPLLSPQIQQRPGHLLRVYRFPFPPPEEQRAISEFLDGRVAGIRATVHLVRETIDRLREYRQSLILAAVTGRIDVRAEAGA